MNVVMSGIKAQGGKELKAHREGKRLTWRQGILAKCYECVGGYVDGKADCEIADCPLYAWMPYGQKKKAQKEKAT